MSRPHLQLRMLRLGAAFVAGWGTACGGGDTPIDPSDEPVLTVTAVTPSSSSRDVTIDLQVQGSGFQSGARAVLARDGDTAFASTKIKSNSTTFQSPSILVLNITIEAGAPLGRYDVVVLDAGTGKASRASAFQFDPFDRGHRPGGRGQQRGVRRKQSRSDRWFAAGEWHRSRLPLGRTAPSGTSAFCPA